VERKIRLRALNGKKVEVPDGHQRKKFQNNKKKLGLDVGKQTASASNGNQSTYVATLGTCRLTVKLSLSVHTAA